MPRGLKFQNSRNVVWFFPCENDRLAIGRKNWSGSLVPNCHSSTDAKAFRLRDTNTDGNGSFRSPANNESQSQSPNQRSALAAVAAMNPRQQQRASSICCRFALINLNCQSRLWPCNTIYKSAKLSRAKDDSSMAKEAKTSPTADGKTLSFDQVLSRLLHRTVSPAKGRNKCLTPFCAVCVNRCRPQSHQIIPTRFRG